MSLFKARELWGASCNNDLYDFGCMKVDNLECNGKNGNSIVTGSYNGFLRIYNPANPYDERDSGRGMRGFNSKAHDMIFEKSFSSPILQIETGRFVK